MVPILARAQTTAAQLTPPIRRVFAHSMILGLAMSVADLLFNFYLVSLGYGTDTAGFLSTVYRFAGVIAGVPIGLTIDRIGPQRVLQVGATLFALGWGVQLMMTEVWALMITQAVIGASGLMALTAVVPLLTGVTTNEQRATVFGLNAGVAAVIGLFGGTVGGLLPGLAAGVLQVGPQTTAAYRLALTVVVALGLCALLPMLRHIRLDSDGTRAARPVGAPQAADRLPAMFLVRMALPALTLGVAAGAFLPFQNLFFRTQFHEPDAVVGTLIAVGALAMGIGAMSGSSVAGRLGLRQASALARLGAAPAMLVMLSPALPIAAVAYLVRGWCIGASYPLTDAYGMQIVSPRHRGAVVSLTSVVWSLGWAATSSVSGLVEKEFGFAPLLAVAAAAYVLSAVAVYYMPNSPHGETPRRTA